MPTGEIVAISLQGLYDRVLGIIPTLIIALIVLILGWIVGIGLGNIIQKVLELIKIDSLANTLGLDRLSARVGRKLSVAAFGNWLVKWFFLVATFLAAAVILG